MVGAATLAGGLSAGAGAVSGSLEIVNLSAMGLSAAIRSRTVSCREVMQAYLAHIERLNGQFNVIVSMRDRAVLLKEADEADIDLQQGRYRGWMHGFPHAVKDLADAKGLVTTNGSPIFRNNVAEADSVPIARIREAGAIFIGKTNVPEFGFGSQTYNTVFGATLNPYDGKSTPGGSSGGAAAGLALRMLPVADGSDLMGSLRNPGAFCNVIGFRPTPGRVPLGDDFAEQLPCSGPMGRNVSDTAQLLATMAGYDPSSPLSLPGDAEQFRAPLERDWKGARIGWLGDFDGYLATEPGVMDLCEKALAGFRAVGCEVEALDLGFDMASLWQTWLTFRHWIARGRGLPLYEDPKLRPQLKPEFVWEVEGGAGVSADAITGASQNRAKWYATLLNAFESFDFLVLPTAQVFPFAATTHWPKTIDGREMDTYHRWMEVVVPGTLSGCPVANVPAGFSKNGLPMGLQVIGPRYEDFRTLQMAFAYEQATRWNLNHLPPVLS